MRHIAILSAHLRHYILDSSGRDLDRPDPRPGAGGSGGAADHQVGAPGAERHRRGVRQGGASLHPQEPPAH